MMYIHPEFCFERRLNNHFNMIVFAPKISPLTQSGTVIEKDPTHWRAVKVESKYFDQTHLSL